MISLTWWYSHDQEDGEVTTSPAEVDALLDRLIAMSKTHWPVLAEVTHTDDDPTSPLVYVGVHVDMGMLSYSDNPETGYRTKGYAPDGEPILYMYMTSDTEYPANSEIPVDLVREAVYEYATTGRRPTCVEWQARQRQA
jgi:hypothetical protein